MQLAKAAKGAELFSGHSAPAYGLWDTERLINEWGNEACVNLMHRLADAFGRTVS
jgi:hypothetical protein